MGTVTLKPRLGEGRYATIDSSIISLSRIKYIKGCFGLTYVSQHKSLQPCLSIQKKFKPLQEENQCLVIAEQTKIKY
ncbi:hypothetical protein BFP75_09900 [Maribacter sp. 4G9]|nr:hypothetical protein BFP75_09900 [Maribacter sp. 4G9]